MNPTTGERLASRAKVKRPLQNALIVAWLSLQLGLPIRALFEQRSDGGGRFGWGMYATRYECRSGYTFHPDRGPARTVDPESYFNDQRRARRVFHRDALPAFHAWLCEELQRTEGPGRLEALVACSTDGGPSEVLVAPGADLCTESAGSSEAP